MDEGSLLDIVIGEHMHIGGDVLMLSNKPRQIFSVIAAGAGRLVTHGELVDFADLTNVHALRVFVAKIRTQVKAMTGGLDPIVGRHLDGGGGGKPGGYALNTAHFNFAGVAAGVRIENLKQKSMRANMRVRRSYEEITLRDGVMMLDDVRLGLTQGQQDILQVLAVHAGSTVDRGTLQEAGNVRGDAALDLEIVRMRGLFNAMSCVYSPVLGPMAADLTEGCTDVRRGYAFNARDYRLILRK